jgi:large subunit ribosomal protein L13Ae
MNNHISFVDVVLIGPSLFIQELEEKRKEKAQVSYERRKELAKLRLKAEKAAEEKLGSQLEILAPIKY